MSKFIHATSNVILNVNNILRVDRYYVRNADFTQWEKEYEETMNKVIGKYLEKHPETLMTDKTDKEIIDELRKKFDKHVKNEIGTMEPGYIDYLIYTKDEQIIYISKEVYDDICNMFDIDMNEDFDDFYNYDDTIYSELNYTWG